jgi:hypothetical protein
VVEPSGGDAVWRSTVPLDRISRSGFAIGTDLISWRIKNVVSNKVHR